MGESLAPPPRAYWMDLPYKNSDCHTEVDLSTISKADRCGFVCVGRLTQPALKNASYNDNYIKMGFSQSSYTISGQ